MEIVFPAKDGSSSVNEVVTSLKLWISELKVSAKVHAPELINH